MTGAIEMDRKRRWGGTGSIVRAAGLATGLAAGLLAAAMPGMSSEVAGAPPLQIRWSEAAFSDGHGRLALTLRNTGTAPLSLRGWSLYVSAITPLEQGHPEDGVEVTQVAGPLFRLRPLTAQAMLAPGASVTLTVRHADRSLLPDKGPVGPYLVYDATPDRGVAITDYAPAPGSAVGGAVADPGALYARNARIRPVPPEALPPVFPTPLNFERLPGTLSVRRVAVEADATLAAEAAFARTLIADGHGDGATALRLRIGRIEGQASPEAYRLRIEPGVGITVTGASSAGVFYGLQSLAQIVAEAPRGVGGLSLPALSITDAPRFGYRGLMIDVARNFQGKERLFAILDLMAQNKLNVLHLHLTDDEGWRLAIPALPELTQVGARRGQGFANGAMLPPSYGSGPSASDPHGSGFYTAEDYVAILRHAQARHITVMPEIEMPGHARAAVKAMAERSRRLAASGRPGAEAYRLADPGDRSRYHSVQGYDDNVIDPGLPSTYHFIDTVVAEVARLHRLAGQPLTTLHMGGDELANGAWRGSPTAQGRDPAELWDTFYDHIAAILARRGIRMAGWEEMGMRKTQTPDGPHQEVNPHFLGRIATLHVWNNLGGAEDLAYRLANRGYDVVLSPATNYYFDMAYQRDRSEPGHDWAGYVDLEDVYRLDPMAMPETGKPGFTALSPTGRDHIVGLEATLFSETVRAPWRLDHMLLPRLYALGERAWAPAPDWVLLTGPARVAAYDAAWSTFATQVGTRLLPRLDHMHPGVAWRVPPPGQLVQGGQVLANSALPGLTLRYTTDGTMPVACSPIFSSPVAAKGIIRVAAFSASGRASRSSDLSFAPETP